MVQSSRASRSLKSKLVRGRRLQRSVADQDMSSAEGVVQLYLHWRPPGHSIPSATWNPDPPNVPEFSCERHHGEGSDSGVPFGGARQLQFPVGQYGSALGEGRECGEACRKGVRVASSKPWTGVGHSTGEAGAAGPCGRTRAGVLAAAARLYVGSASATRSERSQEMDPEARRGRRIGESLHTECQSWQRQHDCLSAR